MREGMRRPGRRARSRRRERLRGARRAFLPPLASRHFAHAAEQPARRPAAEQDRAVGAPRHEGVAETQRPRLLRAPSAETPPAGPRGARRMAPTMGRARRPAFFGVQIVAPRSISASANSPGSFARHEWLQAARGHPPSRRESGVSIAKRRATTRSTFPSTTATGSSKAIARNGGRGVGADAGQRRKFRRVLRKARTRLRGDHAGAAMRLRARE